MSMWRLVISKYIATSEEFVNETILSAEMPTIGIWDGQVDDLSVSDPDKTVFIRTVSVDTGQAKVAALPKDRIAAIYFEIA